MAVSLSVSATQNSQNISNNTSNVTVTATAKWGGGSWNHSGECYGSIIIDGTKYSFSNLILNPNKISSGSQTIMTKTVDVSHNSDGTKNLQYSASFYTGISSSGTQSASGSKVLTTIPRKSSLSASNGTLGTAQTLSVTRQSNSFTHTITYKCGTASGTIATKSSSTSISWTPPVSLASQNTTGTTVSVTLTIATYSGDTNIGSSTQTILCSIPDSIKPSCEISVERVALINDVYDSEWWSNHLIYIQGVTKLKITINATQSYGSPISTYTSKVSNLSYSGQIVTVDAPKDSGTLTITSTVTDKRGRSGTATTTIDVLPCPQCKITKFTGIRCDQDGTSNNRGSYVWPQFSYESGFWNTDYGSTNGIKSDAKIYYKKHADTTWTELLTLNNLKTFPNSDVTEEGIKDQTIFSADTSSSYDIKLVVTDYFNTASMTARIPTAYSLMHWKATGNGIGIGKVSEIDDVFDVGMKTRHYGGLLPIILDPETDLNAVLIPNTYAGGAVQTYNYLNCPFTYGSFSLEVLSTGDGSQIKQRISEGNDTKSRTFERITYDGSTWGDWFCVSDFAGTLLWGSSGSGGLYMSGNHTVTLNELISRQKTGIVLVFSSYVADTQTANDYNWNYFFVPKIMTSLHNGKGANFFMVSSSAFEAVASKYLYIYDDKIVGHAKNLESGTAKGITYNNAYFILRYVIGV